MEHDRECAGHPRASGQHGIFPWTIPLEILLIFKIFPAKINSSQNGIQSQQYCAALAAATRRSRTLRG
jgi:hypothetical protein